MPTRAARCAVTCRQGTPMSADAPDIIRGILNGELARVLAADEGPAAHEVDQLAVKAFEHHVERRLRAVHILDKPDARPTAAEQRQMQGGPATVGPLTSPGYASDRTRSDRQPLQAPGLRVPVRRDLRRLPVHLRLRPPRRAAAAQREGRVVAVDGAAARRRRRPRRGHPRPAAGLGGVAATWPTSPTRSSTARTASSGSVSTSSTTRITCPSCGKRGTFTEARAVQPHVQDPRRPGGGRRRRGLPAARDGAGHVRQLHERAAHHAQEAAVRHRPGRQVVPQRDHARQLRLPHPRVRADGDGVLRPAGRGASSGTSTGATSAISWYLDLGMPDEHAAPAPARRRRAVALLVGHVRRGVPVPVGLGRARGHRQPQRLRPHPARQALGREARVLRPSHQRALHAARHRAGRRCHPHDDRLPARGLRRGRGQGRDRVVLRLHPRLAPVQGRGAAAVEEGRA